MDLSKELRAALLELRDQRLRGISGRQKQYRVGAGTGCKHPNYQLSLPSPRPRVFAFYEQGRRTEPANREWHRANGTYPVSYGLGVVIVSIGFLIAMYPIKPELSALGSFLLMFMAFTTLSFLITTPESVCANLTSYVLKNEPTATGCGDDKVHGDHHKFVTPTVRAMFSPESGVPFEDFLLDRSGHYENEPDGSELRENTSYNTESTSAFNYA